MDEHAAPPFAALLRRHRLAAGLSQEELAERAGLSAQAISALERGVRRAPHRDTVALLADALGLSDEDRSLLAASVARARRTGVALPPPPDAAIGDLPRPATSFVGREREWATVLRLLESSRLLTLTGTGGVGKTRLATHVAAGLAAPLGTHGNGSRSDPYADGIVLVELAALTDPALVPDAVARALGVHEQAGRSLSDALADHLRERSLLLILDNCEHLRAAAGELAERLLRACPRVRILATSRAALAIVGETVWTVPPLSLSRRDRLNSGLRTEDTRLDPSDAVRLFVERATAAYPAFVLADGNAAAVDQICRRLDGLPLAIELAATRARVLTPAEIVARLDDRFRLLTGGEPGAPSRQRTLRAALDWSYDLLDEAERQLLARLAVFVGGCEAAAVEAVWGNGRGQEEGGRVARCPSIVGGDALDLLSSLVGKSLVHADLGGDAARYRLLETVRQYALEKLAGQEDEAAARDAHLSWYVTLAERAESDMIGGGRERWLARLDDEIDNIRAALAWALRAGRTEIGMRLVGALHEFWFYRGYLAEGRRWAGELLAGDDDARRTAARAKALSVAGIYAWVPGNQGGVGAQIEESVAILRAVGDRRGLAFTLLQLAVTQHDLAAARHCFEESRAIYADLGDTFGVARSLGLEGLATYRGRGDVERAIALLEEARRLSRAQHDAHNLGMWTYMLGEIAFYLHDDATARDSFEECLPLVRAAGDQRLTALALTYLGRIADRAGDAERALALLEESQFVRRRRGDAAAISEGLSVQADVLRRRGDIEKAVTLLAESLEIARTLGSASNVAGCLEELAMIAHARHDSARAALIFGAAAALRDRSGDRIAPTWRGVYDQVVAAVRAALGDELFATAWAAGQARSIEAVIGDALELSATVGA